MAYTAFENSYSKRHLFLVFEMQSCDTDPSPNEPEKCGAFKKPYFGEQQYLSDLLKFHVVVKIKLVIEI